MEGEDEVEDRHHPAPHQALPRALPQVHLQALLLVLADRVAVAAVAALVDRGTQVQPGE